MFNVCLISRKVPDLWEGALINRIPRKGKCILACLRPWLVDEDIISSKKQAYIYCKGMIEHVSCFKTGIDDSSVTLVNTMQSSWIDAIGTLPHNVMFLALKELHLSQTVFEKIKDIYGGLYILVICGKHLTAPAPLQEGIKTGCPWNGNNFVLAISPPTLTKRPTPTHGTESMLMEDGKIRSMKSSQCI